MIGQEIFVLLIEDDDVDAEAIERAFKKAGILNPLSRASDGVDGLMRLRGEGKYAALPRPNLILLDLNMPRMGGIEFLREVRSDEQFKDILIFVITTSDAERDKIEAHDLEVAGYIVKSNLSEDFQDLINLFEYYWKSIEFPPKD